MIHLGTYFKSQTEFDNNEKTKIFLSLETNANVTLTPYGLPCIRELLRFLISLCNPLDKQNTDAMVHMGLSLLTIALEVGADSIGKYDSLLEMVKDDLCRNLFAVNQMNKYIFENLVVNNNNHFVIFSQTHFQLLNTERLTIFAADLQVCFLLFESQRICLKFHLEYYLNKLCEIIGSENPRTPYEIRELALDNLLQFLRIPSFSAELYINYDCNLYCTNLLEDLVKLLSKNSLSATNVIYSVHQISLDGLLCIVSDIERNCLRTNAPTPIRGHSRHNSSVESNAIEQNSDLNATTSGGEEMIENIQNIIKNDSKATKRDGNHHRNAEIVTHDQLVEIKNNKRVNEYNCL